MTLPLLLARKHAMPLYYYSLQLLASMRHTVHQKHKRACIVNTMSFHIVLGGECVAPYNDCKIEIRTCYATVKGVLTICGAAQLQPQWWTL